MSDEEDREAVPTTSEVTVKTIPTEDGTPAEAVSIAKLSDGIENPSTEQIKSPSNALSKHEDDEIAEDSNKDDKDWKEDQKQEKESNKTDIQKKPPCPPPQSRCRVRSRDMRQCKKHFREMIGKHEIRNDELEQRETDLRQRLEMLECSMPAVMVWNIWRMAQGAPVSHLRDIVEKQFLEPATGFATCPSTPSQHWDCRVREVEAERKQALHRAEEARKVFAVKGDALTIQKQQIEEARRLQEERKLQITKLEDEARRLQNALRQAQGDENSCETGECGEIQCRQMWLQDVSSVSSIHSTDLECLARLQDLAEAELCMKRQIADLERRECAYMRTLQQADEMWAKMEDDNASNLGDLKGQLDAKIAANQQLADRIVELEDEIEKLRTQLAKASAILNEYKGKTFADKGLGDVDISTEEKIEQTENEEKVKQIPEEGIPDDPSVTKETKSPKSYAVAEAEEMIPLQKDVAKEYTPMVDTNQTQAPVQETLIAPANKDEIRDARTVEAQPDDNQTPVTDKIDTTEDSVQGKPESENAEAQSVTTKPGIEKETPTEKPSRVETTTITEVDPKISMEHSGEQPQNITLLREVSMVEAKHTDKPAVDAGSTHYIPKAPAEDKIPVVSVVAKPEEHSDNQKEAFQLVTESATKQDSKNPTDPVYENASEVTPELPREPITKVPIKAVPKPAAEASEVVTSESPIDTSSEPVNKINPVPTSTNEDIFGPVVEGPSLEPTPAIIESTHIQFSANTLTVPVQTLLSWHNISVCLHKQILRCPQCSSTSEEISQMLEEIRTYLGKDAPDLAKVECANVKEAVQNFVSVPNKKGPCICKPKTCPLEGTPAATPAQANVQMQTVIDGQSQTTTPEKIPSRETRSSRYSKGSTKGKEEVKLMSIEEGAEPDPGMRRVKSIPQARDESTVTVGDIASQTEAIRKIPSLSKDEELEKLCVCPTGVCPKKKEQPPCGECTPGKICAAPKKVQGKEYKSTADAILAPAITVRPSYERTSSPQIVKAKADDTNSESSAFACCMCGKPVTPVASKKSTSIPMSTKSALKSKITLSSECSDDDFLCCACKGKNSQSSKSKYSSPSKYSEKSAEFTGASHGGKPTSGTIKTSCSREICCSCDNQEILVLAKTLTTDLEVSKSKTKPETKDVCCLAKISRDKGPKTESRRRKDKDSLKSATSSVSYTRSGQLSTSSSIYKGSSTNDSSDSNVCCSSIEQVTNMTKKKGKGSKCACDGQKDKNNKDGCACGEDSEPIPSKQGKNIVPTESCLCPPKLFDKS